ncbi:Origin recognition complex subunit 1 [Smittium mucronatum]|uniref:Origin recognition complex subunit 1 n=1 Tax=Smittium mucronatum TaxID=133383 RepID=A0A1R0GXR7_9FUNG|nr:Origin recognition complex subunit 1 [Smittium mucronatum]
MGRLSISDDHKNIQKKKKNIIDVETIYINREPKIKTQPKKTIPRKVISHTLIKKYSSYSTTRNIYPTILVEKPKYKIDPKNIYLDQTFSKNKKELSDSDYSSDYGSYEDSNSDENYSSDDIESDDSDEDFNCIFFICFFLSNFFLFTNYLFLFFFSFKTKSKDYRAKNGYLDIRLPCRTPLAESQISDQSSKFESVLAKLHVSATPESLPCRENECMDIFGELYEALETKTSCCLYISGVPGTGKTATVYEVIRMISLSCESGDLPNFEFIEINGMKLTEPQQLYVQLWKGITGNQTKLTPAHAALMLNDYFTKPSSGKGSQPMKIVFVDELDVLVTKSQSIMYNLFDWPTRSNSNLIVITVANTMDLPERMLQHKISSRLGLKRINFMPYSHEQLTKIVSSRIGDNSIFDQDAVQLCSRKIGAVSGDARRALDVCRRAVEIVQTSLEPNSNSQFKSHGDKSDLNKSQVVTMKIIDQVIREMYSYGFIPIIQNASFHQKIFLISTRAAIRAGGLPETSLGEISRIHHQLSSMFKSPNSSFNQSTIIKIALDISKLGILIVEPDSRLGLSRLVRLNISDDDILMALRPDKVLGKLIVQ